MQNSATQPVGTMQQGAVPVLKKFTTTPDKKKLILPAIAVLIVLLGVGTGWMLAGNKLAFRKSSAPTGGAAPGAKQNSKEAGVADESQFPDEAEGTLVEGDIDGEGTHYLDRDLGPGKYVYLTSTVIDLQSFVGKKVHVWGQSLSARSAPWLMDVGKIKVVE